MRSALLAVALGTWLVAILATYTDGPVAGEFSGNQTREAILGRAP